jgi:hypothetical protein
MRDPVYAAKKNPMVFYFDIEKYANGKRIEMFTLVDFGASIKKPPQIVAEGLLMIEVSLGKPQIGYRERNRKGESELTGFDD